LVVKANLLPRQIYTAVLIHGMAADSGHATGYPRDRSPANRVDSLAWLPRDRYLRTVIMESRVAVEFKVEELAVAERFAVIG
jgi:hypothetical protein